MGFKGMLLMGVLFVGNRAWGQGLVGANPLFSESETTNPRDRRADRSGGRGGTQGISKSTGSNSPSYVEPEDPGGRLRDVEARARAAEQTNQKYATELDAAKKKIAELEQKITTTTDQLIRLRLQVALGVTKAALRGLANAGERLADAFRRSLPTRPDVAARADQTAQAAAAAGNTVEPEVQLRCDGIPKFLNDQTTAIFSENASNTPKSILQTARERQKNANDRAKEADVSLETARLENQKELSADFTSSYSIDAQVKMSLATLESEQCAEIAGTGSDKIQEAQDSANNALNSCNKNANPPNEYTNALASIAQFRATSQNALVSFMQLEKECTATAEESGIAWGTIGLVAGGVAVIGGAGYLIGRNNGKKGGGGGAGPGGGGGGGNTDSKNPPSGNNPCPTGQALNFAGQCVTVVAPGTGAGASPEPSTPITTPNTISIGSDDSGSLTSGAGSNQGAQGRNLSAGAGGGASGGSGSGALDSGSGGAGGGGTGSGSSDSSATRGLGGGGGSGSSVFDPGAGIGSTGEGGTKPTDGAVVESDFSGGKLYPYKKNNKVQTARYRACLKIPECRNQNQDLVKRERERLRKQKSDSSNLFK